MRVLFTSKNLIGDALNISPALRSWYNFAWNHPNNPLTKDSEVFMLTLPDHIAPLYEGMVRDLPYPQPKVVFERPKGKFDIEFDFDVSRAFKISDINKCHIATSYALMLDVPLPKGKPALKPTYIPDIPKTYLDTNTVADIIYAKDIGKKKPILVSMFSHSCTSRDKNTPGLPPNKMVPFEKWIPMIDFLRSRYDVPIRFLGAETDIVPNGYADGLVQPGEYMLHIPLNRLALIMQHATMVVTIDNGMSHLAASQSAHTFLMYPKCLGPHYIVPVGNPNLTWVHIDPVIVTKEQLLTAMHYAVKKREERIEKQAYAKETEDLNKEETNNKEG